MNLGHANSDEQQVRNALAQELNGIDLDSDVLERADGPLLAFYVVNPSARLFRALEKATATLSETNPFKSRSTILPRKRATPSRLNLPETSLLRATISESLTVDRYSFGDDFFGRYTASVTNLEGLVSTNGNFLVYGRRGAGKSSLLSYSMHLLIRDHKPHAWVAMQTYSDQGDIFVTIRVLEEIFSQLTEFSAQRKQLQDAVDELQAINDTVAEATAGLRLQRLLPRLRSALASISAVAPVTIFLDDIHVVAGEYQPELLASIYAICRGNRAYIKASGIEQFTRPWSSKGRRGLEPNHDAQILKLDYNLTVPDRSMDHIRSILDAQAAYCGLPNIAYLMRPGVMERLVLVAAAVPRDALALFSSAVSKADSKKEPRVSVTRVNAAASETAEEKLKDVEKDFADNTQELRNLLEKIKEFCITKKRKNAFLVEIQNTSSTYQDLQKLIALRLVHVLHEGITPHKAGRRYLALMLDYGFYVGIRAATSVELFPQTPRPLTAKEIRRLPILDA